MSSRTSSLSTLTTMPLTMSPSSNSTMVPAMASSNEMPSRSSATTCLGMYSSPSASDGVAVGAGSPASCWAWSDMGLCGRFLYGQVCASTAGGRRPRGRNMARRANRTIAARATVPDGGLGRRPLLGLGPAAAPGQVHLQGHRELARSLHRRQSELGHSLLLRRRHLEDDLVVHLQHHPAGVPAVVQARVQPGQRDLEDVG